MKATLIPCIVVAMLSMPLSQGSADETNTVQFTLTVLDSLHSLHWGSITEAEDEETSSVISSLLTRNRRYKHGQDLMKPYLTDKNEVREVVAKGIVAGSGILIDSTNNLLAHMKKISKDPQAALEENDFVLGQSQVRFSDQSSRRHGGK